MLTVPVSSRDHVLGPATAPVALVEYGDYQCPDSARARPIVRALTERFGDSLAFVFRNFPLADLHPDAMRAAETAEWAALSHRFWPMHDFLFEHQGALDPSSLLNAASHLQLNRKQLEIAWHDRALRHRVIEDISSGLASRVSGTPTFFINGAWYGGSWQLEDLGAALRDAGALEAHGMHGRLP